LITVNTGLHLFGRTIFMRRGNERAAKHAAKLVVGLSGTKKARLSAQNYARQAARTKALLGRSALDGMLDAYALAVAGPINVTCLNVESAIPTACQSHEKVVNSR